MTLQVIVPKNFDTGWLIVPGIIDSVLYATGDALGEGMEFIVPVNGRIDTLLLIDEDKEKIRSDLALFESSFTKITDNAPFDVVTANRLAKIGNIPITNADYVDFTNHSEATVPNVGIVYHAPLGIIYANLVTRGAPTMAAAKNIHIRLLGFVSQDSD